MQVKKETTKITIIATITPAIPKYNPPGETEISFVRTFAVPAAGCVATVLTTVESTCFSATVDFFLYVTYIYIYIYIIMYNE